MKVWHTFGAFGDIVVELTWREIFNLLCGKNIKLHGTSVIISAGKSSEQSLFSAPSREVQLSRHT